jgi:uncharacterized RDD family membrane protein YckC
MSNKLVSSILIISISIAIAFLWMYMKKYYFVKKEFGVAPNSTRVFAFLAEMTVLNVFNFMFILVKFFFITAYKIEFQAFAQSVFNTGDGLGDWFWYNQGKLFLIYLVYCIISESIAQESFFSKFLGLRLLQDKSSKPRFISVLIRNVLKPVTLILFPISLMFSYCTAKRKWLHDWFSDAYLEMEA